MEERDLEAGGLNQGCSRLRATEAWLTRRDRALERYLEEGDPSGLSSSLV